MDGDEDFEEYDQSQVPSIREDVSSSGEDENEPPRKKARGEAVTYSFSRRFDTLQAFEEWWAEEKAQWRAKGKHSLADYDSHTWLCQYGRKKGFNCLKRIRLIFPHDNLSVEIYESEHNHDHDPTDADQLPPLTLEVKNFILEQMSNGLQPARMRVLLSERQCPNLPTLKQIQNFVQRQRSQSSHPFTDAELREYCEGNGVPNDGDSDEPFVLRWEMQNPKKFFVLWTTPKLLELQKTQKLLQCDATNGTNWNSFPLGVHGFTDVDRHFTVSMISVAPSEDAYHYSSVFSSLTAEDYRPQYVLGDGAAGLTSAVNNAFPQSRRLMCYAHVDRRVDKNIMRVPEPLRAQILSDIEALRYARSEHEFDRLVQMMLDSWPVEATSFKDYFLAQWATGELRYWYEAASPYCSTNNGLESANKQIKENYTLRKKLPFKHFIQAVEAILRAASKTAKVPPAKATPKPHLYVDAHRLQAGPDKRLVAKIAGRDTYVYAASSSKFTEMHQVHVVSRVVTDDNNDSVYSCTCPDGARKRLCKHALHVMCDPTVGTYSYPPEALAVPLEANRKRGRPKKVPVQNRFAVAN